ncbi:MAG: flagellar protein [Lachnospiraceae bacterium]|nr:flagellar protein [Lachnospiraceae bacterium]
MNQLQNGRYMSIEQMTNQYLDKTGKSKSTYVSQETGPSFRQILEEKQAQSEELRFSKHANERLASRNIQLSAEQRKRLSGGVDKASQKGIRDSLVMVDNMAFIVNVTNRTVITAVGEGDDKIFTNIDGAIIT